jgi:type 1 fimbria pilin
MNVAEALKLCGGAARTRLEGELRSLQGVPPDAPGEEPRVTFDLTAGTKPTPTQATYTYRVTARTADVGKVAAALTLTHEGGRWLVTSFSEGNEPPT